MDPAPDEVRARDALLAAHRAIAGATTRTALETGVCEALAASDAYAFAWVGALDASGDAVVPRAAAGLPDERGADQQANRDGGTDAPAGEDGWAGPAVTAAETGSVAVQRDLDGEATAAWHERALAAGAAAVAAVPVADGTDRHGVLVVGSARPGAFGAAERDLLADLGASLAAATARAESRADLEAQKRSYEGLVERVSDAHHAVDAGWRVTHWNDRIAERTGRPAAEVEGEVFWEALPELRGTELETQYREAMAEQEPRSFETYLEAPFDYWVAVDVYPDADGLSIFSREVTERKEREQELREKTETLESIIEASPDPIIMLDEEGWKTRLWNPAAEEVFGWSREEVIGERSPHVPDEKDEELERFIERLDQGDPNRFVDTVRRARDGERIDVSLSSVKVEAGEEFTGYVGIFKDIRQRKEYERRLERQRDNLETLNQMVRHDIRNDLQVVGAATEVLAERIDDLSGDDHEVLAECLDRIRTSVENAVALTESAGDLAAVMVEAGGDLEPVSLRTTLREQVEEARTIDDAATVRLDGTVPDVEVMADDMLASAFRNLLQNAVQHNDRAEPDVCVSVTDRGDDVAVSVADDGPGIPDSVKSSVFGRGEKGLDSQGTGIGLYLVETLVDRYGGEVTVADNDPRGTVFTVTLPKAE